MHKVLIPLLVWFSFFAFGIEAIDAAYLKIDSASENYALKRGSQFLEVLDGMYLKVGDQLEIKSSSAHAFVVSNSGQVSPLSIPSGAKTISASDIGADTAGEKVSQTLNWASEWLLQRVGVHSETVSNNRIVQASARGVGNSAPLSVPMAGQGGLRLMAMESQPLILAWSGGNGPFQIEIKSASNQSLAHQEGISGNYFRFPSLTVQPGTYVVTITDQIESINQPLSVVPRTKTGQASKPPRTIDAQSNLEALSDAMKLTERQQGWAFQAYQQAAALEVNLPFARVFMDALEAGDFPSH